MEIVWFLCRPLVVEYWNAIKDWNDRFTILLFLLLLWSSAINTSGRSHIQCKIKSDKITPWMRYRKPYTHIQTQGVNLVLLIHLLVSFRCSMMGHLLWGHVLYTTGTQSMEITGNGMNWNKNGWWTKNRIHASAWTNYSKKTSLKERRTTHTCPALRWLCLHIWINGGKELIKLNGPESRTHP